MVKKELYPCHFHLYINHMCSCVAYFEDQHDKLQVNVNIHHKRTVPCRAVPHPCINALLFTKHYNCAKPYAKADQVNKHTHPQRMMTIVTNTRLGSTKNKTREVKHYLNRMHGDFTPDELSIGCFTFSWIVTGCS